MFCVENLMMSMATARVKEQSGFLVHRDQSREAKLAAKSTALRGKVFRNWSSWILKRGDGRLTEVWGKYIGYGSAGAEVSLDVRYPIIDALDEEAFGLISRL